MNVEVGRRVFVGSVVAGLPLFGAGARFALAPQDAATPVRGPVLDQLLLEMKGTVKAFSASPSGEHARRLASSLRLLAAWGATSNIDARVKRSLRDAIARDGRDAILWREFDPVAFRAEARELGFDERSPVRVPVLPTVDFATRRRVLDDTLANGVSARWKALADTLDAAATALDRRASLRRGDQTLVAQDPADCTQLAQSLSLLTAEMVFWCGPWFWWFPEGCILVSAAFLGLYAANWWLGCPWW